MEGRREVTVPVIDASEENGIFIYEQTSWPPPMLAKNSMQYDPKIDENFNPFKWVSPWTKKKNPLMQTRNHHYSSKANQEKQ